MLCVMRTKRYYVYILASKSRVLYIGMTGFLMSRLLQHKAGDGGRFTAKCRVNRLIYYEAFEHVETAIRREAELKKWRRAKKLALIESKNPTWEDLADGWGKPVPMAYRPVRSKSYSKDCHSEPL